MKRQELTPGSVVLYLNSLSEAIAAAVKHDLHPELPHKIMAACTTLLATAETGRTPSLRKARPAKSTDAAAPGRSPERAEPRKPVRCDVALSIIQPGETVRIKEVVARMGATGDILGCKAASNVLGKLARRQQLSVVARGIYRRLDSSPDDK